MGGFHTSNATAQLDETVVRRGHLVQGLAGPGSSALELILGANTRPPGLTSAVFLGHVLTRVSICLGAMEEAPHGENASHPKTDLLFL